MYLDTRWAPTSGPSVTLLPGANLQAALNAATCGTEIRLSPGASYTSNLTIGKNCATNPIHVRPDGPLTPEGVRVTPAMAASFPKIVSPDYQAVLQTAIGARGYRFVNVEFTVGPAATFSYGLVVLGRGDVETTLAMMPGNIVLDRVYIHGRAGVSTSRCLAFNGDSLAVVDSYLSECHAAGTDAQAVAGWNGPGPFKIVNNHLEGAGENVLFGGGDPRIANLVPSDIELRRNYIVKPLSWYGSQWTVKNSIELKNARRVLIEANVIENNWAQGQVGFALVFASMNQGGTAPWSTVQDVTYRRNWLANTGSGINIGGIGYGVAVPAARILVEENVVLSSSQNWGEGRLVQMLSGAVDVTLRHNTFLHPATGPHSSAINFDGAPQVRFKAIDNLITFGTYGVNGAGVGDGTTTLTAFAPGSVFLGNVLAMNYPNYWGTGIGTRYPAGNYFPQTMTGLLDGELRLLLASLKGKATDGRDPGANIDALLAAIAGVRP